MFRKRSFKIALLGISLFVLLALAGHNRGLLAGVVTPTPVSGGLFDSPLPTPPASPTPPPAPTPSPQARIALQYISEREGIPLDDLLVAHEHRREYPLLGRQFMAFTIFDRVTHRSFRLLVDLDDDSVVDDVAAVEQAEAEARRAKYGKLHPLLYERLQTADDKELLPVAVWLGGEYGHSRREVYAILASRYPEVQEALARHSSPFDVDDPALARHIRAEYERIRQEDISARIQPLVTYLESRGTTIETHFLLPSVTATLSKEDILALTKRDDVQTIYLIEGEGEPLLDTAVHTNRVAPVWSALGINGIPEPTIPITIAIVERGNVDWDNSFLHHATIRLVGIDGETDHATRVASAAASFHDTYRGMAPGATILSAGADDTMPGGHFALNWALDKNADVVNVSYGWYNNTPNLEWLDRAFDYTARERSATIMVAAGNRLYEHMISPAKGWNVITAGGINDKGNTAWSDDEMWEDYPDPGDGSAYKDPIGGTHGDREKPEVVAPAQDITALGIGDQGEPDQPITWHGTSLASPQVAGLAALLMHHNPDVELWPTAVKAILMAAAVHNIEGDSHLSEKDGAGSIDAALADTVVQTHQSDGVTCSGPCWWAVNTSEDYPAVGDWLYQHFTASRGERIRVAIAWWSEADPPPSYPTLGDDTLASDFDLRVWSPSDSDWWSSASWDNNYEIVEFIAPETGTYKIGVKKYSSSETENQLGIAWVKDATYLPDLRNKDDWVSEIYIRNDGAEPRAVTIHYFDPNGNPTPKVSDTCTLALNQRCWIPVDADNRIPPGTTGLAIVGGGEDVSVVVETHYSPQGVRERYNNYNGIAAGGNDPEWGQVGKDIYVPLVKKEHGKYNKTSHFYILNAGSTDTVVTLTGYYASGDQSGDPAFQQTQPLGPNARWELTTPTTEEGQYCARIQASQPLAVVVAEEKDSDPTTVYKVQNALSSAATDGFAPQVKRNLNPPINDFTTLAIQNTGTSVATVQVIYYPHDADPCGHSKDVSPKGFEVFAPDEVGTCPGSFRGSAWITTASSQPLAVLVNERGVKGYSGFLEGSRSVVASRVERGNGWWTGIRVMNVDGEAPTNGTIYFYNSDGSQNGNGKSFTISEPYREVNLGGEVPQPYFNGSAIIIADHPIAVAVTMALNGGASERTMIYNGVNR